MNTITDYHHRSKSVEFWSGVSDGKKITFRHYEYHSVIVRSEIGDLVPTLLFSQDSVRGTELFEIVLFASCSNNLTCHSTRSQPSLQPGVAKI